MILCSDAHQGAGSMWLSWSCGQLQGPIAWLTRQLAWVGSSPSRTAASVWRLAHTPLPQPPQALLSPQASAVHARRILNPSIVLITEACYLVLNDSHHSKFGPTVGLAGQDYVEAKARVALPVSFPTHKLVLLLPFSAAV